MCACVRASVRRHHKARALRGEERRAGSLQLQPFTLGAAARAPQLEPDPPLNAGRVGGELKWPGPQVDAVRIAARARRRAAAFRSPAPASLLAGAAAPLRCAGGAAGAAGRRRGRPLPRRGAPEPSRSRSHVGRRRAVRPEAAPIVLLSFEPRRRRRRRCSAAAEAAVAAATTTCRFIILTTPAPPATEALH